MDKLSVVSISKKQAKAELKSAMFEIYTLKMELEINKICMLMLCILMFKWHLYSSKHVWIQPREALAKAVNK